MPSDVHLFIVNEAYRNSKPNTSAVLLNFITLVIQDVRSILVTRFAVDIDQLLSKLFWQFLVICYSSEVTCVNLFKKLSFVTYLSETLEFFFQIDF